MYLYLFCFALPGRLFMALKRKSHLMPYILPRHPEVHADRGYYITPSEPRMPIRELQEIYGIIQGPPSFAPKKSKSGEIWGFGDNQPCGGKAKRPCQINHTTVF